MAASDNVRAIWLKNQLGRLKTLLHTDTKKPTFKANIIQKPGDYQGTYCFFMTVPPNATSTAGQGGAAMLLPRQ